MFLSLSPNCLEPSLAAGSFERSSVIPEVKLLEGRFRHPGEALRDQMVKAGLGVAETAKYMGVSRQQLHLMFRGARFSAAHAIRLEELFDVPASQWLALQVDNDLEVARVHLARMKRLAVSIPTPSKARTFRIGRILTV
jgi:addiction module HigA family antidote